MKSISSPYDGLLLDLLSECRKAWGQNLVSFVVYGSVARGDYRKDSDIDLFIVCRELTGDKLKRQELFIEIEDKLDLGRIYEKGFYPNFSPVLKTVHEAEQLSPLYLDMVEDAVILYDLEGFFRKVLDRLSVGLRRLGARRVSIGTKWYWDLRPGSDHMEDVVIE